MARRKPSTTKSKKFSPYRKAEFIEFARFIAYPQVLQESEFGFHTEEGFAKANHVDHSTLVEWKKTEEFWDERDKWMRLWGKRQTPEVLRGVQRNAIKDGNAAGAKLHMQIFEDFKERSETDIPALRESLARIQQNTKAIIEGAKTKKVTAKK